MVSRLARAVNLVRDAVALLLSVVILGSQWGKWQQDPVFYISGGIAGLILTLSAIDVTLIVIRVKGRGYFLANSIIQLFPGLLMVGLFAPAGVPLTILNVIAIISLRQKKTAEELVLHPPVPITKMYRTAVILGVLVMAGSMLLPAISTSNASLSLLGFYAALVNHSPLPSADVTGTRAIFALLGFVLPPAGVIFAALGLIRRKLSVVGGILVAAGGAGIIVALSSDAGIGSYVMIVGGVIVIGAWMVLRRPGSASTGQ